MKSERDDRLLEDAIRIAVGSEDVRFDAGSWMKKYREEVSIIKSRKAGAATGDSRRRRIRKTVMSIRSMKIAASAAAVAGIAIAVIIWASGSGSTVALADVLEQLQTQSYEFTMDVRAPGGPSTSVKGMVLEPGKLRMEQHAGTETIASIVDIDANESLILFERVKAAYRFDRKEQKEVGMLGFLILPGRSIGDLWNLQAGSEIKLGQKEIDGQTVEGFRVTQKHDDYTETITVWADAETAHPLKVDIVWQSGKQEKPVFELTLTDFKVVPEPNPDLFSTRVPEGYTLANRKTLEQLTAEPGPDSPTAGGTSTQAKMILEVHNLWVAGNKHKAIDLLMKVDWKDDIRFSREHYLFTMTEKQYISLVAADQSKVMDEIIEHMPQYRAIARELINLGRQAHTAGEADRAEHYFRTAVCLGRVLNSNADAMLIVRMVGIAIQQGALDKLTGIYEERGETEKLKAAREQLKQLEKQKDAIKRTIGQ